METDRILYVTSTLVMRKARILFEGKARDDSVKRALSGLVIGRGLHASEARHVEQRSAIL